MALKLETRVKRNASKLLKFFGPKGERWTAGFEAIDKDGIPVKAKAKNAVKFCLTGAFAKFNIPEGVQSAFQDKVAPKFNYLVDFNDSHKTYTHVRRFLERVANGGL